MRSRTLAARTWLGSAESVPRRTRSFRATVIGPGESEAGTRQRYPPATTCGRCEPSARHRDALATGEGADEAVAAEDKRRDHVVVFVEQLDLAAGELPRGDRGEAGKLAAGGRGAVAVAARLLRLGQVEPALGGSGDDGPAAEELGLGQTARKVSAGSCG